MTAFTLGNSVFLSATSACTASGVITSSASSHIMKGFVAWENASLRASEKSSCHGKSYTLSVKRSATSLVASVEPVSTMMISSIASRTLSRHTGRLFSSFLTIMQSDSSTAHSPFTSAFPRLTPRSFMA